MRKPIQFLSIATSCDCCTAINNIVEDLGFNFSKEEEEKLLDDIFKGVVTPDNLPVNLYAATGNSLIKAMTEGFSNNEYLSLGSLPDPKFVEALTDNAFRFSGAKTFQQVREMSDFLLDSDGKTASFSSFKKQATKTFGDYNKNYLRAEYNHAQSGGQMASKWESIIEDAEDFPYLQYLTAGDGRVRPEHKDLDNVIRPVTDVNFWGKFYPPNGWNCRCDVIRLSEAPDGVTPLENKKLPVLKDEFDFNVGVNREIFSPEHPYFIVESQYKGLAKNNFNLPIPNAKG